MAYNEGVVPSNIACSRNAKMTENVMPTATRDACVNEHAIAGSNAWHSIQSAANATSNRSSPSVGGLK